MNENTYTVAEAIANFGSPPETPSTEKLLDLIKQTGSTLNLQKDWTDFDIDAPDGQTWRCAHGLHSLIVAQWYDETLEEGYRDTVERMELGLEPCPYHKDTCQGDLAGAMSRTQTATQPYYKDMLDDPHHLIT